MYGKNLGKLASKIRMFGRENINGLGTHTEGNQSKTK